MALKELWSYFHWGDKQNTTHWEAYCKACVLTISKRLRLMGAWDASGELLKRSEGFQTAVNQEIELVEALVNDEEDAIPDDGAIGRSDDDFEG
jgi:hypothetical protein